MSNILGILTTIILESIKQFIDITSSDKNTFKH